MPSFDHITTEHCADLEKYPTKHFINLLSHGDQMHQTYMKLRLTAYKSNMDGMHKQQQQKMKVTNNLTVLLTSSTVLLLVCATLPRAAGLSPSNFSSSPQLPSNTIYRDDQHDDVRCKCVCPSPQVVFRDSSPTQRRLYVGNSSPEQCNCYNVVQPHIDPKMLLQIKDFCARCECKYQSRNTATIRWSVLFVVFVLSILCLYMLAYSLWENYRLHGARGFPIPSFLKGSRLDNEPLSLN